MNINRMIVMKIRFKTMISHDADRAELLEAFRYLGNGCCAGAVTCGSLAVQFWQARLIEAAARSVSEKTGTERLHALSLEPPRTPYKDAGLTTTGPLCQPARPVYLSRTSELEGARYIFRYHFDQKIDEFLADILGEVAPPPLPPPAPGELSLTLAPAIPGNIGVHRTLPRKLGGPGIMAYGGPAGET